MEKIYYYIKKLYSNCINNLCRQTTKSIFNYNLITKEYRRLISIMAIRYSKFIMCSIFLLLYDNYNSVNSTFNEKYQIFITTNIVFNLSIYY